MTVKLTERLQWMADMVAEGERAADIGSDHGLLPLYLLEQGISPGVIVTDVNKGPLEKAAANFKAAGLADKGDLRLGDGLSVLQPGEVDTVVIAGMGGILISQILSAEPEKTRSFRKFILQPRTAAPELREWLYLNGFVTVAEELTVENGHFCELMVTIPEESLAGFQQEVQEGDARLVKMAEAESRRKWREKAAKSYEEELLFEISPLLRMQGDEIFLAWMDAKITEEEKILTALKNAPGSAASQEKIPLTEERLVKLKAVRNGEIL